MTFQPAERPEVGADQATIFVLQLNAAHCLTKTQYFLNMTVGFCLSQAEERNTSER